MRLTQDVASETRPRRDKPLNYVRVRDETESLGTLGLETETRPRLSSLSGHAHARNSQKSVQSFISIPLTVVASYMLISVHRSIVNLTLK